MTLTLVSRLCPMSNSYKIFSYTTCKPLYSHIPHISLGHTSVILCQSIFKLQLHTDRQTHRQTDRQTDRYSVVTMRNRNKNKKIKDSKKNGHKKLMQHAKTRLQIAKIGFCVILLFITSVSI